MGVRAVWLGGDLTVLDDHDLPTGQVIATRPAPAAERLIHELPLAFEHEHGRLHSALETAAQVAELAGHDDLAKTLRDHRRAVAREIGDGRCV